ncbi:hypothetical protein HYY74_03520 [Candidatus Woesearchaeota archaeon]|nr:hypothetical protein [Candidatus Woesearchaeota archaeon]
MESGEVTTGADKLVALVSGKKRISTVDAAKELSVPRVVIEEWADFLHEKGIIDVEYKFTTPFLVKREFTKEEISRKSKDFESKKDVFIRQVESAIGTLNKESSGLRRVKEEFSRLGAELEQDVKKVRGELATLQNYEDLKRNIDRQILDQQQSFKRQMEQVESQILGSQKSYDELISHIREQELKLDEEVQKADLIKKNELILKERVAKIEEAVRDMKKQLQDEDADLEALRQNIIRMKRFAEQIRKGIELRKREFAPLLDRKRQHQKRIEDVQARILDKVAQAKGKVVDTVSASQSAREAFERFFREKVKIDILMDRINTDFAKLRAELDGIVQEARLMEITGAPKASMHIEELEQRFAAAHKKREKFESEIFELGRLIKGKVNK